MHWPPPKRRDPTPGKRGAGHIVDRACDGSAKQPCTIASIESTDIALNDVSSLLNRSAVSTQQISSALTR